MSCISIEVSLLNKSPTLSVDRLGDCISVDVSRADIPIVVKAFDMASHLKVGCSVVCSIKELKNYLKVSPSDVQWITPEYGVIYNVESDMDWIIVTT